VLWRSENHGQSWIPLSESTAWAFSKPLLTYRAPRISALRRPVAVGWVC